MLELLETHATVYHMQQNTHLYSICYNIELQDLLDLYLAVLLSYIPFLLTFVIQSWNLFVHMPESTNRQIGRAIIGLVLYKSVSPVLAYDIKLTHQRAIKIITLLNWSERARILTVLFSSSSLRTLRNLRNFPSWTLETVIASCSESRVSFCCESCKLSSRLLYSDGLRFSPQQIFLVYTISIAIWQKKTPLRSRREIPGGSSAITRNTNTLIAPTSRMDAATPCSVYTYLSAQCHAF